MNITRTKRYDPIAKAYHRIGEILYEHRPTFESTKQQFKRAWAFQQRHGRQALQTAKIASDLYYGDYLDAAVAVARFPKTRVYKESVVPYRKRYVSQYKDWRPKTAEQLSAYRGSSGYEELEEEYPEAYHSDFNDSDRWDQIEDDIWTNIDTHDDGSMQVSDAYEDP